MTKINGTETKNNDSAKDLTGFPSLDRPWLHNYPEGAEKDVTDDINVKMYDFMYERVKDSLDSPAMEYFGVVITYGEMLAQIEAFAKALYGYGIRRGDLVSVCLPNIPEVVYLKYALNRIGAVANMMDPRINPRGILERIRLSDSRLLFVMSGLEGKIKEIEEEIGDCTVVFISPSHSLPKKVWRQTRETLPVNIVCFLKNRGKKHLAMKCLSVQDFLALGRNVTASFDVPYEPDMPVTALYTSGTTADKMSAGLFTNENYNALVKNMKYGSSHIRPGKRFLGVIPFFSAYGSFCGCHHSFCNAWCVIMIPKFHPDRFAELLVKTRANAVLGVPKFWEQFLEMERTDLSFLEMPVTGGDWIPKESVTKINACFESSGCKEKLKVGYGATEFSGVVAATSDDTDKYDPESVGILLPGNRAMVIDPDTEDELAYGQEGELCISSPTMMAGYLNDPEKTAAITLYKDGVKYYRTGDKVKIDQRGSILFCDRYKRVMMRPDGHTVACTPIEDVLHSYPKIKKCAVVGVKLKKEASGAIPTAFIVLQDATTDPMETAREIDRFCCTKLGERERALAITFVDAIPYTPNGKIDFKKLEDTRFEEIEYYACEKTFFEGGR